MIVKLTKKQIFLLLSSIATWQSDYEGTSDFDIWAQPLSKLQDKLEAAVNLK